MKLRHEEDIAAPRDVTFAAFSDLDGLMAKLAPRGVELSRDDHPAPPASGSLWRTSIDFHGLVRSVEIRLQDLSPPRGYTLAGMSKELSAALAVSFEALGAARTRMALEITIRPRAISGHMLMPPLHMLRPKFEARLATHLGAWAREIEAQA